MLLHQKWSHLYYVLTEKMYISNKNKYNSARAR